MKRAKFHRSHLQQTVKMKSDLLNNQKQHIIDIVDEYVGDIIKSVDEGVDWNASDQSQINIQYQDVIGILAKASALLDDMATNLLDVLFKDESDHATLGNQDGDSVTEKHVMEGDNEIGGKTCDVARNKEGLISVQRPIEEEPCPKTVLDHPLSNSLALHNVSNCQITTSGPKLEDVYTQNEESPPLLEKTISSFTPSNTHSLPPPSQNTSQFHPLSSPVVTHPVTVCFTNTPSPRLPWTTSASSSSLSNLQHFPNHQQAHLVHLLNRPPPPPPPPPPFIIPSTNHTSMAGMALTSVVGKYHGQPLIITSHSSVPSFVNRQQTVTHQMLHPPVAAPPPSFIQTPMSSVMQHHHTVSMPTLTPQLPLLPSNGLPQLQAIPPMTLPVQMGTTNRFTTPSPTVLAPTPPLLPTSEPQLESTLPHCFDVKDVNATSSSTHFTMGQTRTESVPENSISMNYSPNDLTKSLKTLNPDSDSFLPESVDSSSALKENRQQKSTNHVTNLGKELHNERLGSFSCEEFTTSLDATSPPFLPKSVSAKNQLSTEGLPQNIEESIRAPVASEYSSCAKPLGSAKTKESSSTVMSKSSIYNNKNNSASCGDFSQLIEKFSELESEIGNKFSKQNHQLKDTVELNHKGKTSKPLQTKITKGSILAVTVSELDSPWSFHVQLDGDLDQIAKDISDYMKGNDGNEEDSLSLLVKPGMFCLALFPDDGGYYRAKVLEVEGESISVVYVDYGNTSKVSPSHLRLLPVSLATKPIMALWCALSGAAPTNSENMWTEEAILYFQQNVCHQSVQMRVVQLASDNSESGASIPHLVNIVFKTSTKSSTDSQPYETVKPVDMSRMLIKEKLAKAIGLKDQVGALISLNRPVEKKAMNSESLSKLDNLINLMKMSTTSSPCKSDISAPVISGPRKPEPLCFTNLRRRNGSKMVESFKNDMLKSSGNSTSSGSPNLSRAGEENGYEKDLVPTREQEENYKLACLVDKLLHQFQNEVEGKVNPLVLEYFKGHHSQTDEDKSMIKTILTLDKGNAKESERSSRSGSGGVEMVDACSDLSDPDTELEFPVMVSEILTPNSFFVHPITQDAAVAMETLEAELADQADRSESTVGKRGNSNATFIPRKHKLCCAQFLKGKNMYCRASVLDIFAEEVLVFAIDYGFYEWQHASRLQPLPAKYTDLPPLVLWCSLAYTQPVCTRVTRCGQGQGQREIDDPDWTWSAVERFKQMVGKDKILNVIVTNAFVDKCIERWPTIQLEELPIYLLDRGKPGDEICLNHELIHRGLATIRKPPLDDAYNDDGSDDYLPGMDEMDGSGERWNPMMEDFYSLRNSYKVDVDDPGVALVGYKARDVGPEGRRVCVFYNRPEGCFKGKRCPFIHADVQDQVLSFDQQPVFQYESDQSSFLPSPDTLVAVSPSTIFSPHMFYVTLPWAGLTLNHVNSDPSSANQRVAQVENLETLMESLQSFYRGSHYDGDMTTKAQGQAIAAKVGADWLRAKVLDVDPDNEQIQVMCIDFGDNYWVHERNVRDMEMRFLHLPPQAVECCLEECTNGDQAMTAWMWDRNTVGLFAEMIKDKLLIGHVKFRLASGRLVLSLIHTTTSGQTLNVGEEMVNTFYLTRPSHEGVLKAPKIQPATNLNLKQISVGENYFPG